MAEYGNPKGVLFNDGELALGFATPGDTVPLGPNTGHKYAKSFYKGGGDVAVIKTKSGNKYYLCDGVLFDQNDTCLLVKENIEITPEIGRSLRLPNGAVTSKVQSVLLRYKALGNPSAHNGPKVNTPSPFDKAIKRAQEIQATIGKTPRKSAPPLR